MIKKYKQDQQLLYCSLAVQNPTVFPVLATIAFGQPSFRFGAALALPLPSSLPSVSSPSSSSPLPPPYGRILLSLTSLVLSTVSSQPSVGNQLINQFFSILITNQYYQF
jgi:hypothetical protein